MPQSILTSPAAGNFLRGFQCDPFAGWMRIPLATRDATDPSGYRLSSCLISPETHTTAANLCRDITREADEFIGSEGRAHLPHTNKEWVIERAVGMGIHLLYLGPDSLRWNKITLADDGIEMSRVAENREVSMDWLMLPDIDDPDWQFGFQYKIKLKDLALLGLRKYFQLPSNISIEALRTTIFKLLHIPQDVLEKDFALKAFLRLIADRMPMNLGAPIGQGQKLEIEASVSVAENGFRELMGIYVDYEDGHGGWYQPLPEPLHGLWNFATQDDLGLPPTENLQTYRELTRSIYRTREKPV